MASSLEDFDKGWGVLPPKQELERPTNPVSPQVRQFSTGATRDQDVTKHDPEGFLSPLVIERYNEYMTANRLQKDGNLRDSDNWQMGIPFPVYMKSLWRHFHDVWLHHRGYAHIAKEPLEVALCGLLFNTMGYLHETLKAHSETQGSVFNELGKL